MKPRTLWLSLAVVLMVVMAGLLAHHRSSPNMRGMPMSSAGATATDQVAISNYMFSPAAIKVKAGTTVTWTNKDSVSHTVTADTATADAPSSMDISQGKSYSFTFKKAGTYTYHCFPHPYMHGTVEVN